MSGWRFDREAMDLLARERWQLSWPVRIVRKRYRTWAGWHTVHTTWGEYCRTRYPNGSKTVEVTRWHTIAVDGSHGIEVALRTLAHELEHAAQAERLGVQTFQRIYLDNEAGFEYHAAKAENRWRELLPAVKGAP